jgi:excisionase family DNA binding protein
MTPAEAAERLEVKAGLVYKLCSEGRLGHTRLGFGRGTIRISEADLAAYLDSVRVLPSPPPAPDGPKPAARVVPRRAPRDYIAELKQKRGAR